MQRFRKENKQKANHPFTGYNSLNILSLPVLLIHFDYIIIYLMGTWLNNGERKNTQNKTARKFGNRSSVAVVVNKLREAPQETPKEPEDESRARVVDLMKELNSRKSNF